MTGLVSILQPPLRRWLLTVSLRPAQLMNGKAESYFRAAGLCFHSPLMHNLPPSFVIREIPREHTYSLLLVKPTQ